MAKKLKKRKEPHPTLFVHEGSIKLYPEGSMLELHTLVTEQEWFAIAHETVKYKCFVECLKEIACPALEEQWTEEDDWFRVQLDVAISRIRNIDALLVASINQKQIKEEYNKWVNNNIQQIKTLIEQLRQQQKEFLQQHLDNGDTISVSDL